MNNKPRLHLSTSDPEPMLVIGSVAFDNIETPFARGDNILGGSAAYAALAASYFSPVRLVGVVGRDFGDEHTNRLRNHGVDLTGLQVDDSGDTFFWSGRYHKNFNRRDTLELKLNVFERFNPELPELYQKTPYVMLGNIHPSLQIHVLDQMQGKPFILADSMDFWIEAALDDLLALIRRVDCFLLNDSEACMLTGEHNTINAGWKLLEMGPKMVVVKKGEHGACLFHPDGFFMLPAYPVTNLQDPTGAGDSFAGSMLGYLAAVGEVSLESLKTALAYATVTASLTVEAFSCDRLETSGVEEISGRYEQLCQMTRLP